MEENCHLLHCWFSPHSINRTLDFEFLAFLNTNSSWGAGSGLPSLQHFSIEIKTRIAAQTETAGDSEELLARVVDPTSSSYFLPVAGEVTTQIKGRKFHMNLFYKI